MPAANDIEQITKPLRQSLGDNIPWQFEAKLNVMLSEFAQNKSAVVLDNLRNTLTDEWHAKNAKKMPHSLKSQLGDLAKISKNQLILACPETKDTPAIVALWWPWGHGGTYSLRLKVLENSYCREELVQSSGFFEKLKSMFS